MEKLEELVHDLSIKGLEKSCGTGDLFFCFDTTMELVDKWGRGEEWSWVRRRNVDEFIKEH